MSDLTTADIDRAYRTTLDRGTQLVRRRNQRRAAFGGLGVVVLLLGGFGVLRSLGDGANDVIVTPADRSGRDQAGTSLLAPTIPTTTESSVPAPVVPDGFVRTPLPDGVVSYENTTEPPEQTTTTLENGVRLADPGNADRTGGVTGWVFVSPTQLHVTFACVRTTGDRVDSVLFRRVGAEVEVKASISATNRGEPCGGGTGAEIDLFFPEGDLPTDAIAVDGVFTDPEG